MISYAGGAFASRIEPVDVSALRRKKGGPPFMKEPPLFLYSGKMFKYELFSDQPQETFFGFRVGYGTLRLRRG